VVYPADGVYAGWYRDDVVGVKAAAISVGRRPTFLEGAEPLIEAFVLDFEGNLYGRRAGVSFLERLRGQQRFESVDELITQMNADVAAARIRLAEGASWAPQALPLG